MIKIFNPNDTDFTSNGNICIEPLSCIEYKKKSLNGWYLDIKIDIKYKDYIKKDYLVVLKTKSSINPQAFRIADDENENTIQYTDRTISFKANHVFFDSKRYFLVDVRPSKLNAIAVLEYINTRTDRKSPFFVYSDVDSISTAYFIRKNLLEAWEVIEDRWGGYFEFDNWNVRFMSTIGKETDEIIAYGQKLQGLQIFESWANVVTKLYPVGNNGIMLDEQFIESDIQYDVPYTRTISFSSDLEPEDQTDENLKKELKKKAQQHINKNKYPLLSYEVSSDINQSLNIGDKIIIKHPLINIKTEVTEYAFDHVRPKIISIVFGNFVRDVKSKFDSIKQSIISQSERLSEQEKILIHQTDLINNLNKNGIVYIGDNEILILDRVPKEQAKNVWRWGLGGFAFSSNGYEGPFSTAITMDGRINADFITTGKINTNLIEGYEQLVQKVSKTEESVENIITTTQTSTGNNHLYIDESLEENVLEYIIYGKTVEDSSEIQTIPSIRNEFNIETDSFSSLGFGFEFDGSKMILNGTSRSSGNSVIESKTKLSKGTYTISFSKLGGTYEKNSYDFQIFVQGSTNTDKRFANITGSRLENSENKKTTITLEEETEIYLYFYCSGADLILNNYEIGIQIEKGTIVHEYRPFGNYIKIKVSNEDYSLSNELLIDLQENELCTNDILKIENGNTILYKEEEKISLGNYDIPLFKGFNHVELCDDLETNTSIKFLRKTPLTNDFVVQPQLSETNKNLSKTDEKTNQNSSDINATNTNLNNNYYSKNQINEMQTTTNQNIVQVRNTVEALTTSTEYRINAINETITNGVPLVKTTSTSFGEEGWSMEKSGEEMSSNWNWKGLEVTKDKGKSTEEKKLVVNSDGAIMSNSETKNRSIQRPIMMEKGTSISDGQSVGLCHYYIGE